MGVLSWVVTVTGTACGLHEKISAEICFSHFKSCDHTIGNL